MTDAEAHQQELEQIEYEQTVAHLQDEYGHEIKAHIWADDETVFVNLGAYPLGFSIHLNKDQAGKVLELLTNALRRIE